MLFLMMEARVQVFWLQVTMLFQHCIDLHCLIFVESILKSPGASVCNHFYYPMNSSIGSQCGGIRSYGSCKWNTHTQLLSEWEGIITCMRPKERTQDSFPHHPMAAAEPSLLLSFLLHLFLLLLIIKSPMFLHALFHLTFLINLRRFFLSLE